MVCVDGRVFECESVSRLCAWCVLMGVSLNVRVFLDCVYNYILCVTDQLYIYYIVNVSS